MLSLAHGMLASGLQREQIFPSVWTSLGYSPCFQTLQNSATSSVSYLCTPKSDRLSTPTRISVESVLTPCKIHHLYTVSGRKNNNVISVLPWLCYQTILDLFLFEKQGDNQNYHVSLHCKIFLLYSFQVLSAESE